MDEITIDMKDEFNEIKHICECKNCHEIFKDPVRINSCKHVICKTCLGDVNENEEYKCPICKVNCNKEDVCDDNYMLHAITFYNDVFINSTWPVFDHTIIPCSEMAKNHLGETPLHKACKFGKLNIVKVYIQGNAHLNSKDNAGWSPLHDAVVHKHLNCIEALLEAGANVNIAGFMYKTPLLLALEHNLEGIVAVLLKFGADPYCLDYYGVAPMDIASESLKKLMQYNKCDKMKSNIYIRSQIKAYLADMGILGVSNNSVQLVDYKDFLVNDDITHLIIKQNERIGLSYLIALLKGCFIVTDNFLKQKIERNWLLQTVNFIPNDKKRAILKAAENALMQKPRLFDKMFFYIMNCGNGIHKFDGFNLNHNDLVFLVEMGGGTILRREPALRIAENIKDFPYHLKNCPALRQCSYYIIYMKERKPVLCYNAKELRSKSSSWLVNCILNFELFDD